METEKVKRHLGKKSNKVKEKYQGTVSYFKVYLNFTSFFPRSSQKVPF